MSSVLKNKSKYWVDQS